ncbi:hypothetical protein LCGC14_0668770 [marine sediment metagenome]|uniref:Uncharacterized protein n=1 Tax=marine sediment metagenome TaxID=412755 RepID=A0A0F9QRK0_9ZZZZ
MTTPESEKDEKKKQEEQTVDLGELDPEELLAWGVRAQQEIRHHENQLITAERTRAALAGTVDTLKGELKTLVDAMNRVAKANSEQKKSNRELGPAISHAKGVLDGLGKRKRSDTPTFG